MAAVTEVQAVADLEALVEKKPWHVAALDLARRQPLGAAGAFIVIIMILTAASAEFIAPYDPLVNDFENMLLAPGAEYWLGTDEFGRDILSRLIYGARTALFVGFVAAVIGATAGLVLGVAPRRVF